MTMGSDYTPTLGARVVTADGDEIGRVKEISGACFKVDAPMQPDYWLGMDCVAFSSPSEVRLTVAKDDLGEVKASAPDHRGVHRHRDGDMV